ncbi:hypothetical protein JCM10213v2_000970 [Rhodosporidiobolus nylandii]
MATASAGLKAAATPSLETSDYLETRSAQVSMEWRVSSLRTLFDQTKGEVKSKCVKSALFDNARWQIFLYPNSGNDQYVSLYLSCEPTAAEKERALAEQASGIGGTGANSEDGRGKEKERIQWRRDGKFKFTFEVRSADRRSLFKQMEADNHSFTWKERNWGYASMISRREAYYNNPSTRASDAFIVVCTIVSSPTLPTSPPVPHLLIPKDLVSAYASLFDDPDYADIVFRIRPENGRKAGNGRVKEKRLYAAKKVLAGRSEYFETMFNSGFTESTLPGAARSASHTRTVTLSELDDEGELSLEGESSSSFDSEDEGWDEDDDSQVDERDSQDDEGDEGDAESLANPARVPALSTTPAPSDQLFPTTALRSPNSSSAPSNTLERPVVTSSSSLSAPTSTPRSRTSSASLTDDERDSEHFRSAGPSSRAESTAEEDAGADEDETASGGVQAEDDSLAPSESPPPKSTAFVDAPNAPASPEKAATLPSSTTVGPVSVAGSTGQTGGKTERKKKGDGRERFEVVVTDASYSTFRALLNFLYTDSISFAPLASTYYIARDVAAAGGQAFPHLSRRAFLLSHAPQIPPGNGQHTVGACSSKAIYRLADKMGLDELKGRAYEHIVRSLTAENASLQLLLH